MTIPRPCRLRRSQRRGPMRLPRPFTTARPIGSKCRPSRTARSPLPISATAFPKPTALRREARRATSRLLALKLLSKRTVRMEMGLRRLNMPILPFVNLASFHHESHALKGCNVRERITVDGDQIRFKTRHDGADRVLQIHRLRAARG